MRVSFAFVTAVLLLATPALAQEAADPAAQLYLEGADLASRGEWKQALSAFDVAEESKAFAPLRGSSLVEHLRVLLGARAPRPKPRLALCGPRSLPRGPDATGVHARGP